jgi:hypothetical protein
MENIMIALLRPWVVVQKLSTERVVGPPTSGICTGSSKIKWAKCEAIVSSCRLVDVENVSFAMPSICFHIFSEIAVPSRTISSDRHHYCTTSPLLRWVWVWQKDAAPVLYRASEAHGLNAICKCRPFASRRLNWFAKSFLTPSTKRAPTGRVELLITDHYAINEHFFRSSPFVLHLRDLKCYGSAISSSRKSYLKRTGKGVMKNSNKKNKTYKTHFFFFFFFSLNPSYFQSL